MNIIKFYRTVHFFTQTDLSKLTGIDQYRISRIEAGTAPTDDEWQALAKGFGMTVAELRGTYCGNEIESYLLSRRALGHLNGIPEGNILMDLGINERKLRKMVQRERMGGALICNEYDVHGYYLAATADEKQRFLRRHMAVIRTLSRECKAFRDDLKASGEIPRA